MNIDFTAIPEIDNEHFKGGDGHFIIRPFTDMPGRVMKVRLTPKSSVGKHTHETNYEIIYVISGEGKAVTGAGEDNLLAGCVHYCPPGASHSLINTGSEDLVMLCVLPDTP
ncbi:MAG TPA: cupin domain-containing protein [Methanocorpusculum sp.]|nr:cupin domain-containing protein [Methanocorpusculum sp.]